jgi:hypothetical protein
VSASHIGKYSGLLGQILVCHEHFLIPPEFKFAFMLHNADSKKAFFKLNYKEPNSVEYTVFLEKLMSIS